MSTSSPVGGSTLRAAAVLVVDDDLVTLRTTALLLRHLNLQVVEADTGASAITTIRSRSFDLVLIDFRLPDISGLDIIVQLKKDHISVPWLLMSGGMTTPVAVEAMRLGAIDAVDLPCDVESVVISALHSASKSASCMWPRLPSPSLLPRPRSAAERWASLVLRASVMAESDVKTIADWASIVGSSYTVVAERCRLVGIRPHDARDFLRVLRALYLADGRLAHLQDGLDVNDSRTLKALFARAGISTAPTADAISLRAYVDRQTFVDPASEAMRVLLRMIEGG